MEDDMKRKDMLIQNINNKSEAEIKSKRVRDELISDLKVTIYRVNSLQ